MTAVVVMAKAPVPGRVKTRLCPPLSPDRAARLASAFAVDTWASAVRVAGPLARLAYAGPRQRFAPPLRDAAGFAQVGGDLGARIEHAARAGLALADRAVVIGTDAPGLPPALIAAAAAELAACDAVLGPAVDGGYYLIGLRRCEPGLLADLPWSAPDTLRATERRLRARGFRVARLPVWFDVDDAAGLALLRAAIAAGAVDAPATKSALVQEEPCDCP